MSIWEEIAKRSESAAEVDRAELQATFEAQVIKPLEDLIVKPAKAALGPLEAFVPHALSIVARARQSKYWPDYEVSHVALEIETVCNNVPQSIRRGLEFYASLRPESLLRRDGILDINAPANLIGSLKGYLSGSSDHLPNLQRFIE